MDRQSQRANAAMARTSRKASAARIATAWMAAIVCALLTAHGTPPASAQGQASAARQLAETSAGVWRVIRTIADSAGIERVLLIQKEKL